MQAAVDLHIHSCLSPCADDGMTPNNIVGMAYLKGLDIISVTDHNRAKNAPAISRVAREMGVEFLPGIEVQSREEVHVLAYFESVDALLDFDKWLYFHLPDIKNRPEFFGRQVVMDERDQILGEEEKLLVQSADVEFGALIARIVGMGGAAVPAHINKSSNSILAMLGFLPPGQPYAALEAFSGVPMPPDAETGNFKLLYSSDAHQLCDISEREHFLSLPEPTAAALFYDLLRRSKNFVK